VFPLARSFAPCSVQMLARAASLGASPALDSAGRVLNVPYGYASGPPASSALDLPRSARDAAVKTHLRFHREPKQHHPERPGKPTVESPLARRIRLLSLLAPRME